MLPKMFPAGSRPNTAVAGVLSSLNSDPPSASVQPTAAATQNEAAESIDANFVLIGAAVVLGVILLTTGKD